MNAFENYSTTFPTTFPSTFPARSSRKSSAIPGLSLHPAIYATSSTTVQDDLVSFLSYIKTRNIPILPVTLPDVRSVLGQGASFLVNGAEMPETYTDPVSGIVFPKGMVVAFKRAILNDDMTDPIANRILVIFNEVLTMCHPPLLAHPNIVKLLGVGFEIEGPSGHEYAMPVLVPECAELGNLAEVLETARKEDRPLSYEEKISLVVDVAHGLEILHACDIVHGDVKCENVLIFPAEEGGQKGDVKVENKSDLRCKLTDFGVLRRHDGVLLGGSRPWQAPECSGTSFFQIEAAKRTDIYSFGMLLWRVMLDGDPFKALGKFEGNMRESRQKRNEAIATLKEEDNLVQHVCASLALSGKFSRPQLEMLCEVINMVLSKNPHHRELDLSRLIRFLLPNNFYHARHPVEPERISMNPEIQLLDLEKWYSEVKLASPVVQSCIAQGFRKHAERPSEDSDTGHENQSAAANQLAICYAIGFGVDFQPDECLKWFRFAAESGSLKAREVIPKIIRTFNTFPKDIASFPNANPESSTSSIAQEDESYLFVNETGSITTDNFTEDMPIESTWTILGAAEACRYDILMFLLSKSVKPGISEDGVSPLHFFSSWDISIAEELGRKLILAGVDINGNSKRGSSVGGTPLMWSVYGNHLNHSAILLKLGADPLVTTDDGIDSLSFATQLHLTSHLRLLLENVRPAQIRGHLRRLIEAAASGESRFVRMTRHESEWKTAAAETLLLLQGWNSLFTDEPDFKNLLLPALHHSLFSAYGRMNSDVQISYIDDHKINPSELGDLLRDSVVTFNKEVFEALLDRGVPVNGCFEQRKNLLHLCAKIPDHITAAAVFAPRLIALGADVEGVDDTGLTPWMFAALERKWDLADLFLAEGAKALATDNEGYNVLGLSIKAINVGTIKYLLKYCTARLAFHEESFLTNPTKNLSALQQTATLSLPRAHGMKIEVIGTFLIILANFGSRSQVDFRSDAILPNATALEIAAFNGNVHSVKNLVKNGAHKVRGNRAVELARSKLVDATGYLERKNLERCIFIVENWDRDEEGTRRLADDWTNMRTIDESHVKSSWELIVWDYKVLKETN